MGVIPSANLPTRLASPVNRTFLYLLTCVCLLGLPLQAQYGAGGHAKSKLYTRTQGDTLQIAVEVRIDHGWHLYHSELGHPDAVGKPTQLKFTGEGLRFRSVIFPEPFKVIQEGFAEDGGDAWIWEHEGTILLHAEGKLALETAMPEVKLKITGLTCEENGQCMPYSEDLSSAGHGQDAHFAHFPDFTAEFQAKSAGGDENRGDDEAPVEEEGGLLAFLLLCVGGGLFTLLMPCTYPMIPITISFFTKQADKAGSAPIGLSLAYGSGIVLIFILTGVVVGPAIIQFATHWLTNLIIGAFFINFAFVLLGLVTLQALDSARIPMVFSQQSPQRNSKWAEF